MVPIPEQAEKINNLRSDANAVGGGGGSALLAVAVGLGPLPAFGLGVTVAVGLNHSTRQVFPGDVVASTVTIAPANTDSGYSVTLASSFYRANDQLPGAVTEVMQPQNLVAKGIYSTANTKEFTAFLKANGPQPIQRDPILDAYD